MTDFTQLKAALMEAVKAVNSMESESLFTQPAVPAVPVMKLAPTPPPVPEGFIKMPVTGHLLPKPKPEIQTSFWGYMIEAADEAGGLPGSFGPYAAGMAWKEYAEWKGVSESVLVDPKYWPEILDYHYNINAYDPGGKEARAAAARASQEQWDAVWAEKMKNKADADAKKGGDFDYSPSPQPPADSTTTI